MRISLQFSTTFVLLVCGSLAAVGCHKAQVSPPRTKPVAAAPPASNEPERDGAWSRRAVVVNIDPGNALTQRRSESHFTPRTSRASVDSHTSSLLVQVAALNQLVAEKAPIIEQQLRELGLNVVETKHRKLHKPNAYNVLVEDVTYVEEVERKHEWEPIVYTMTPAIHVRVISANQRSSFEAPAITVRSYGPMTSQAAEGYGKQLASARVSLGKRLVEWLESRLPPAAANASAAAAPVSPTAPAASSAKPVPQSSHSLGHDGTETQG